MALGQAEFRQRGVLAERRPRALQRVDLVTRRRPPERERPLGDRIVHARGNGEAGIGIVRLLADLAGEIVELGLPGRLLAEIEPHGRRRAGRKAETEIEAE